MQVTDAVKVGVQAIKENHVTLAEVQTCLEEVDEAISQQRETQTALGTGSSHFSCFFIFHAFSYAWVFRLFPDQSEVSVSPSSSVILRHMIPFGYA